MLKNFIAMPGFLQCLVGLGAVMPILVFLTLLRAQESNQLALNWLAIGFLAPCVALIWGSSFLFLKRVRASRVVWLVGWTSLSLHSFFPVVDVARSNESLGAQVVTNLILGLLIGIYLFKSKAVIRYFENELSEAEQLPVGPLSILVVQWNYLGALWTHCKMCFIKVLKRIF